MRTEKQQSAFTLLEIMLVISIIVVLLGVAINKLIGNMDIAKMVAVKADIQAIRTQLKLYESMNGYPPTTEQGLQALVTQPSSDPKPQRWHQLLEEIPTDPWHNHYIYLCPGRKNSTGYDLYSAGKDRKPDTADDDWGG